MTTTPPPDANDEPGYFDLQVNGYAGIDFNQDDLSAEQLHAACERLRADGVDAILATIITDATDAMAGRLARLVELRAQDPLVQAMIAGLHIEGPFISPAPGFRGAHPLDAIGPAEESLMQRLIEAGGGLTKLVTLAPEHDENMAVTTMLTKQGVTVSAGHCDPTLDQLDAAIDAGLSMFTHVGNGCPMQMDRHDNIIQRALSRADRLWLCFIADGVHVPPTALTNYLRLAGDRAVVVTDAMAAAGMGPGLHKLGRWEVEVGEDLVAWAPGKAHLVGAAMSMPQMNTILHERCGLDAGHCRALTRTNPRRAIGF